MDDVKKRSTYIIRPNILTYDNGRALLNENIKHAIRHCGWFSYFGLVSLNFSLGNGLWKTSRRD